MIQKFMDKTEYRTIALKEIGLSKAEVKTMNLAISNLKTSQISSLLNIKQGTVKFHLTNGLRKIKMKRVQDVMHSFSEYEGKIEADELIYMANTLPEVKKGNKKFKKDKIQLPKGRSK